MKNILLWILKIVLGVIILFFMLYFLLSIPPKEESVIEYGMSFNTLYARELGLDFKEVYDALLNDLKVKHLRLAAHWPMIEPEKDLYNWDELDYQIHMAQNHNADVILAVGRRLPRWPECHIPQWAQNLSWDNQKEE